MPSTEHLIMRCLTCFTPASASPLLAGLYGEEISCVTSKAARNSLNS